MAHGHHRGHALFEQLAGHAGRDVLLGLGRLAGFQEHHRDAVVADQPGQFVGGDHLSAAVFQLVGIPGVFEAEDAQSVLAAVHAVPVEVDHVVRLAGRVRGRRALPKRGEGRRGQDRQLDQVAQLLQGRDQRQCMAR